MKTSDYNYDLPQEKIAIYPLPQRDGSKLLIYKNGALTHAPFICLDEYLPGNSFLFLNNTKVIPARLHFKKETGATIEVFLLHPLAPSSLLMETMAAKGRTSWQCAIGNSRRWASGTVLTLALGQTVLEARLSTRGKNVVDFTWRSSAQTFAEILNAAGEIPLPPYIKRKAENLDRERYQTLYSRSEGAVAAPTAGLHFTEQVFNRLKERNIHHDFLTLHVSAGTFLPVKTDNPAEHVMHQEQMVVTRMNVENLLQPGRFVIAVGTTSMRTLESLYWFGVKLLQDPESEFVIGQSDPYALPAAEPQQAMKAILEYMDRNGLDHLVGETSIFIKPGYDFKVCRGLITNFHQPASTLIMLVAAFVGEDWRKIYEEALKNNYRFLSYGDSSLLMPR